MSDASFESDEGVEAALTAAIQQDAAAEASEQARHTPKAVTPPAGETVTPADPAVQPAPAAQEAPAPNTPDLFDGTPINPDTLPPELQPLAKQLQAAFTQKTQGIAEQAKQFEALGSVEELEQAVELFNRLSDPNNWPEIHSNLTKALEEQGLTTAQAEAEATRQIEATATPALETDDPDLAPFAEALKAQQAELAELKAQRANEVRDAQAARERESMLAQLSSMVNAVKTANPSYEEVDMDYVYKLGAFHETNLLEAQKDYQAIGERAVERYIASKTAVPRAVEAAPAHAAQATTVAGEEKTLQQVAEELEASVRASQAAGEFDGF